MLKDNLSVTNLILKKTKSKKDDLNESDNLLKKIELIREADWNFTNNENRRGLHKIHPYPAKFIPEIPRKLIKILNPTLGSTILDPFCGCGTTLLEAQIAGYSAVGIDLNPIAALISRVKTRKLKNRIYPLALQKIKEASKYKCIIPKIPNLDHWFEADVQKALAKLVAVIADTKQIAEREALQVALSSIIVQVSNQESDTRYAAVKKIVTEKRVFDLFSKSASDIDKAYDLTFANLFRKHRPPVNVINKDILTVTPLEIDENVQLVITSPPYPNAYEYWLYHKYRMFWLGMDPIAVKRCEIGARPHYFKKNHQTEKDFETQMEQVFKLIKSVLKPSGAACFLVGRSIIHRRVINNVALLERAASKSGFKMLVSVNRKIPANRKSFNPSHGKINKESLVIFGR